MIRCLVSVVALAVIASVAVARDSFVFQRQFGSIEPDPPLERMLGDPLTVLGRRLFFDAGLSGTGTTACATCHDPAYAFAQPARVSQSDRGRLGQRNAPSILNADLLPALMWDGRFATLEQQALSPFRRGEMGIDINEAVTRLNSNRQYVQMFRAALRARPSANGMARALAAYQQTLISGESRVDRFLLDGETAILTPLEQEGFRIFDTKAACSTCHALQPRVTRSGYRLPLLADFRFHNLGIGYDSGEFADPGRFGVTRTEADLGSFRTPSLRNVAITAPYMHDGSLATLEDVVDFYDAGGRPNPYLSALLRPLLLANSEKSALVAFLRALTDQRHESPKLTGQPAFPR